MYVDENNALVN